MNKTLPLISFVIVTMNRMDYLQKCLQSICDQNYPNKEIIVVDNASEDDTSAMVARDFPDVKLLQQKTNTGAAGGKNIGMKAANGEFIICLDDDETFEIKDVAEQVLDHFLKYKDAAVLCFNNLIPETMSTQQSRIPRRDKKMLTEDTYIGYFFGGGCAFRNSALKEVGYYWEALNPYGAEEYDISYRFLDAGYDILWCKNIEIIHHETPIINITGRYIYALARNHTLVALKNLPLKYLISHYICLWGYAFILSVKSRQIMPWFKGVLGSLSETKSALRQRKVITSKTVKKLKQYAGPIWY